jgi:lysophospholipase L1-like esterase
LLGVKSRRRIALVLFLVPTLLLALAASAGAAKHVTRKKAIHALAKVRLEKVAFAHTPSGEPALLLALRYPIQMANRSVSYEAKITGGVGIRLGGGAAIASGPLRKPERRRSFTFVHEFDLTRGESRELEAAWREGRHLRVGVRPQGAIDIDGDGLADFTPGYVKPGAGALPSVPLSRAGASATASSASGSGAKPLCGSVPLLQVAPGSKTTVHLPACTDSVNWKIARPADAGSAHIAGGELTYRAPNQAGSERVLLNHGDVEIRVAKPWTPATGALLGNSGAEGPVVRAMGDSVTAGYGYYSDGSQMSIWELPGCKPVGEILDDACSSNSTVTKSGLKEITYAPDYGLANDVSWAAQWANEYGVTNYKNFAITGSEPTNWAPGGDDYATTKQIEEEDPDYILMTIGANPILANTLFGLEPMACAIEADILGDYRLCVEEAFESVHLRAELKRLYVNLVESTHATIYLMQYHLAVPSSALAYTATQIAEMAKLMNETIAEVAAEVSPSRLQVVTPPHFDVGVNLEPVYPASYSCSRFGFKVDGPSVQATPSQDELALTHPLSFCKGPAGGGKPWIISGDTGIHPSAVGYAQMASQVPAPTP